MNTVLYTIGYESKTLPQVISDLHAADVAVVIDVRAVAASRRAGFSKTLLWNSLKAEGIDYEHLRSLGTPKRGREAARKGLIDEMEEIFGDHMETPEAREGLVRAAAIVRERKAALLCFEACASGCHRRIVADLIREAIGISVRHL